MLIHQYLFNIRKFSNIDNIIKYKYYEIFKYHISLYEDIDINKAFKITIETNCLDIAKYLILKYSTYLIIKDERYLIYACQGFQNPTNSSNHLDIVKYLIKKQVPKCNIHIHENFPLRWASLHGHLNIVKYLVEEYLQHLNASALGTNIHYYYTWAARLANKRGYHNVVKYLVEKGASSPLNTQYNDSLEWHFRNSNYFEVIFLNTVFSS